MQIPLLAGGLEHLDYFPIYWECHHPLTNSIIFQRDRYTTNQSYSFDRPGISISPSWPESVGTIPKWNSGFALPGGSSHFPICGCNPTPVTYVHTYIYIYMYIYIYIHTYNHELQFNSSWLVKPMLATRH